jgi:hypothetical protein
MIGEIALIENNKDLVKYLRDLDSSNEPSIQENGVQNVLDLVKTGRLTVKNLIHPTYGKQYWENSARVLSQLPQEYINGYEALLFDAIQDSNWPGNELLVELISRQPISRIIQLYKSAYEQAKLESDECWIYNLYLLGGKLNVQYQMNDTLDEMRQILDILDN